MKLKTKLIPLVGLSTMSAVVAPLSLTSCGNTYMGKTVNLSKGFTSSYKAHEECSLSNQEILELYTERIKDDPEAFVQDFLWAKANSGLAMEQFRTFILLAQFPMNMSSLVLEAKVGPSPIAYDYDKESISKVKVDVASPLVEKDQLDYPILSFDWKADSKLNSNIVKLICGATGDFPLETLLDYDFNLTMSSTISFKNVPFMFAFRKNIPIIAYSTIQFDESGDPEIEPYTGDFLFFEPHYAWLNKETGKYEQSQTLDWSADIKYDATLSVESKTAGIVDKKVINWEFEINSKTIGDLPELYTAFVPFNEFVSPYYLHKVTCVDPVEPEPKSNY